MKTNSRKPKRPAEAKTSRTDQRNGDYAQRRFRLCGDCKHYWDLKKVGCFREGQCTRFPPSVHPKTKYKPGQYFSYYPLVENIKEVCGEFQAGQYDYGFKYKQPNDKGQRLRLGRRERVSG
jgi:hypothetical protein